MTVMPRRASRSRKGSLSYPRSPITRSGFCREVANLNPFGGAGAADNAVTGHGTQIPVRLFEIPITNHTVAGDAVYDPFCGSGTALIAAEKLVNNQTISEVPLFRPCPDASWCYSRPTVANRVDQRFITEEGPT
jgi:DNA modification methylase